MNDVSVLFPLPTTQADINNLLVPSASGAKGVLVPADLYNNVMTTALANISGQGFPAYADLRLVAMRIDPCFASLAPDPHGVGCAAQIRLVFQAIDWNSSGAWASDSGLHAFYSLTRGEFLALARALVGLRRANGNGDATGPLAPNPIMTSQGLSGPMAQGVEALILQYAGQQNLERVAQLISIDNEAGLIWTMSVFDVGPGASDATPRPIPTLGDGGDVTAEGLSAEIFGTFADSEPTTSPDDFSVLDGTDAGSLPLAVAQKAFDGLVRIENPKDNSANTIDCGSCHLAMATAVGVAKPVFGFDDRTSPLAFQPDGISVNAADMTPTYDPTLGPSSIHVFSYLGQLPSIDQRVVNETAAVVEYLNNLSP
jgi:hypothetical protein